MIGIRNQLSTRIVTTFSTDALASIIRDLIDADRYASNSAMALEASDRLGQTISVEQVSRTRRRIGLGKNRLRQQDLSRSNMGHFLYQDAYPQADEVQLTVGDVAESIAFYKRIGLRAMEQTTGVGTVSVGRQPLWLTVGSNISPPHTFTLSIRHLELYRAFLREQHVSFFERDIPSGQGRELVITDPDGHALVVRDSPHAARP